MSHPRRSPPSHAIRYRLPVLTGAVLMLALAGCSIVLPERHTPPVNAEANAAVPPPPDVSAPSGARRSAPALADHGQPLPEAETFRGVLPCADCTGQRVTLTLMPDWTWRMRRVYFGTRDGKDTTIVTTGRWERALDNQRQVRLIGDRNDNGIYEFAAGSGTMTLRVLNIDGRPIESSLIYSLTQQYDLDPITDSFTLRGKVLSANGASTMTICSTGKSYPVSQDGQGKALADAYANLHLPTGAPALMWIDGHVVPAGEPPAEQLVVDSLSGGTLDSPCD